MFKKIAIGLALTSAMFAYWIHEPIPEEVEDPIVFQALVNVLSFSEKMATISEKVGVNRWWAYPGRLPLPNFLFIKRDLNVEYVNLKGVECVIVKPKGYNEQENPGPAIIYYHGGGWVFGDLESYLPLLIDAAEQTGFIVMSPGYRMAPENVFPIPFEDCINSTMEFMVRAAEFNVDPSKIALSGDSAGGNLAMAINVELIKKKKINQDLQLPAMLALIYPKLQTANYLLPSYVQNRKFVFSKNLIPKFWLAYIGLSTRYDLADIICENGHIDYNDKQVVAKLSIVHEDNVPNKFKMRPYDATPSAISAKKMKSLDTKTKAYLNKMLLDERIAPLMASDEILLQLPSTYILVCEYDALRDDGIMLHERMKKLKKAVTLHYQPKSLHASVSLGPIDKHLYHAKENLKLFKFIKDGLDGKLS